MSDSASDSGQEYEEIDKEMIKRGQSIDNWSPSKRPPIPIPGLPGAKNKGGGGGGGGGGVDELGALPPPPPLLPGMRASRVTRSQSLNTYTDNAPPPLPPPNVKSASKSASTPPAPARRPRQQQKQPKPPPAPPPNAKTNGPEMPPIVPPKPKPVVVESPSKKKRVEDDFNIDSAELNPMDFVTRYQDDLPLHVRVSKGFYGNSDRTSVSEGDIFNIHFIKNTKVVCMQDGGGGDFKIALNSGLEFGILFDPNNKRDEATAGFMFEKVSDLLQAKSLPKAVRTTSAWRGPGMESTIEKNELLILKGWKRKINGKLLKVYSLTTKKKKELPENCEGKFVTKSYDTRLFLAEMIEHVLNPLPCEAVIYMNSDTYQEANLPNSLTSSVLTLKALETETTLIATNVWEDFDEMQAIEIPMDIDIEFQVMHPNEAKETEDLYQSTRKLLENYAKLKSSQYVRANGDANVAQSAIYSIVREGSELTGVDLVRPSNIYMNTSSPSTSTTTSLATSFTTPSVPLPSPSHLPTTTPPPNVAAAVAAMAATGRGSRGASVSSEVFYDDTYTPSSAPSAALNKRVKAIENDITQLTDKLGALNDVPEMNSKISREVTAARADMKRLGTRCSKAAEDAATAQTEISEIKNMVEQIRRTCDSFQKEVQSLRENTVQDGALSSSARPGYMTLSHKSPLEGEEALWARNKEYLRSLDSNQMLNLLDSMGLLQHQAAFLSERVTGEILLECDDLVLQEELKITSKLQRVRLMKIISGRHSAEMLLKGEDPYAYTR